MDDKKKILLGSSDIISKNNEDLFLNVELSRTFSEIRDDKFENTFDILQQYNKERNTSRSFRIYGIVDSNVADCPNINIDIYKSFEITYNTVPNVPFPIPSITLTDKVKTVVATALPYNGYNIFGKKRAKYLIDLDNYTHDFVYLSMPGNGNLYNGQTFAQQLVFRNPDGSVIDYGTKSIEIDDNGNALSVDNDFPFFYNKHWIKKDLIITKKI